VHRTYDSATGTKAAPVVAAPSGIYAADMNVTATESIDIAASPEAVWDFTQDWKQRMRWDATVSEVEILEVDPVVVRVVQGGLRFVNRYKVSDRPVRTSLAMTEIVPSTVVVSGGGSWSYRPNPTGGTTWTQVNTLKLRNRWLLFFLGPFLKRQLARATRVSMVKAKAILEASQPSASAPV
jgi:hypothetical protein